MAFGITSIFSKGFTAGQRPLVISGAGQLPNLEVWYYADVNTNLNGITSGSDVTAWANAGGLTSHDWNSTGGRRPTWVSNVQNGKGVVRFNPAGSTTQYLSINPIAYLQALPAVTMVLLFRTLSTAAGRRIATSTNTGGFQWGQDGSQWVGQFSGASFTVDNHTVDTSFHHVAITFNGSQTGNTNRLKVRLDGTDTPITYLTNVNATTSASASTFYGGLDQTGNSGYWQGDIGELMIWTRALNTGEIVAVEEYLTKKWNV